MWYLIRFFRRKDLWPNYLVFLMRLDILILFWITCPGLRVISTLDINAKYIKIYWRGSCLYVFIFYVMSRLQNDNKFPHQTFCILATIHGPFQSGSSRRVERAAMDSTPSGPQTSFRRAALTLADEWWQAAMIVTTPPLLPRSLHPPTPVVAGTTVITLRTVASAPRQSRRRTRQFPLPV